MADRSRFTQGTSEKTTRIITKPAVDPKPGSRGMPGYIRTRQDASSAGLTSPNGPGMHVEGPIGQRGPMSRSFDTSKARGSSDKHYRATSTGAGVITPNTRTGLKGARASSEREGPQRGKPSRGAPQYGGTAPGPGSQGHRGRMETLIGRALTSAERKR